MPIILSSDPGNLLLSTLDLYDESLPIIKYRKTYNIVSVSTMGKNVNSIHTKVSYNEFYRFLILHTLNMK